jgi:threonine synthase
MNHYCYKCFDCKTQFSIEEIEPNLHYLCPQCGKVELNQPLKGVLLIEYDYSSLKKQLNKQDFMKLPVGQFWHYPQLLPLNFRNQSGQFIYEKIVSSQLNRLSLIDHPLVEYEFEDRKIYFFDDTRNPTLSYKDRASSLVALKALQSEISDISVASTGNAASSLAGICARLGLNAHIFVPASIPEEKLIQIQSLGASIYLVDGNYDQAFDLCVEISKIKGWYNRNTAFNPLTIEGKKSAAYDLFISMKGDLPEYIFVPVGDGVIISGIYKGLWELLQLGWIEMMPRLITVQAEGSDSLVRYLKTGQFEYKTPTTIADSISAGAPRNLYMAAHAVKESWGEALVVSDHEILNAQKILAQQMGWLVEPAAAASFAGYLKFKEKILDKEKALIMLTGNGLKDVRALKRWNVIPISHTFEEWRKIFEEIPKSK